MIDIKTELLPECASEHSAGPVLAVGMLTEQARTWLLGVGAEIVVGGPVHVVVLPERAILERQGAWWSYCVQVFDADGNEIAPGLDFDFHVDARESMLSLRAA